MHCFSPEAGQGTVRCVPRMQVEERWEVTDIAFKGNDWERWLARGRDSQQICATSPFMQAQAQKKICS